MLPCSTVAAIVRPLFAHVRKLHLKEEIGMKRLLSTLLCLAALSMASAAQADTYSGTLRIVTNTGVADTLRFRVEPPGTLSLFTSGDSKDIILQGYYRKAFMSINYTPNACPPGISGTCGTVTSVTVTSVNF